MLPEGYEPSKTVVAISAMILAAFAIYASITYVKRRDALRGEVRYIPATISRVYFTTNGRNIEYKYLVGGLTYSNHSTYAYESLVGGRYWIKFSVEYPDVCEIYQNMPVDSRIDTIPPIGFKGRYDYNQFLKWRKWAAQQNGKK